jgi:hypothetical protein
MNSLRKFPIYLWLMNKKMNSVFLLFTMEDLEVPIDQTPSGVRVNMHGAEICHYFGCRKHMRLIEQFGGKWCSRHLPEIRQLHNSLSEDEFKFRLLKLKTKDDSKLCYASRNIDGKELCNAVGCRTYKNLLEVFRNKWCLYHLKEILRIRSIIERHTGDNEEYEARLEELRLRKNADDAHYQYARTLEKKYVD